MKNNKGFSLVELIVVIAIMAILAAVMVTVVIIVGGIVFTWNKKRMKSGYVPGWDDDEK